MDEVNREHRFADHFHLQGSKEKRVWATLRVDRPSAGINRGVFIKLES